MVSGGRRTDQTDLIDVGGIEPSFEEEITEAPDDRTVPSEVLGRDFHHPEEEASGPVIAEIRERFAAFLIDLLCLYILYWPAMLIYRTITLGSSAGPIPAAGMNGLIFHGIFLLMAFIWFTIPEMAFHASLGKLLCHLAVHRTDGTHVSFTSIVIRNFFRPIDMILFPCLLLTASMEWTAWHRRPGDIIARTVVIKRTGNPPRQYALSLEIIASATRRAIAFIFDFALFAAFVFGYGLLLNPEHPIGSMLILVFSPAAMIAFFTIPEWLFKTSPGKWLFGMTICNEEGASIGLPAALIRTAWRPLDNNPWGFLTMLFSLRRQRPGDAAAAAVVICAPREARGFLGLVLWLLLTASICYFGMNNRDSFLSSDFQINFLPSIDLRKTAAPSEGVKQLNLQIKDFGFAEGEKKMPRRPSIYEPGEMVYMIFDVAGYTVSEGKAWVQEDLIISYPDGSVGLKLENINDFNQKLEKAGVIRFENNISLPANAQPGRYTVTITIRDKLSQRDLKEQRFFYVTPPDASSAEPQKAEPTEKPAAGTEKEKPRADRRRRSETFD